MTNNGVPPATAIDLRFGEWQTILRDDFDDTLPECDAIITDPPFGARTHKVAKERKLRSDGSDTKLLAPDYPPWTRDHVFDFVRAWSKPCRGWIVTMTSHDLVPHWEDAYKEAGRYCFAPLPAVMIGMSVRLRGDGPSSWSVWLVVSRPATREFTEWGTLPGAYVGPASREANSGRGKPGWLLRSLVADYSRKGDRIVDPMCGWGSTLLAAESLGRRALGCDGHEPTYLRAVQEIKQAHQMELFT